MVSKEEMIELAKVLNPVREKINVRLELVKEWDVPPNEVQTLFKEIASFLELINKLSRTSTGTI